MLNIKKASLPEAFFLPQLLNKQQQLLIKVNRN